ncbi:MAG: hypothetical protein ACXW5U_03935 [Thermoanaerobaculia bacterium]
MCHRLAAPVVQQADLTLLFGAEFEAGTVPLMILCCSQLVNVLFGSVAVILNMTGNEGMTARGVGIAAVTNIVLNLLLMPTYGVVGAACASLVSMITWNMVLAWSATRRTALHSTIFGVVHRRSAP